MDLGISTNPTPELYTIKVTGEIDISNADSLRNAINLALEQPTEAVELDFAQVSYIDSGDFDHGGISPAPKRAVPFGICL